MSLPLIRAVLLLAAAAIMFWLASRRPDQGGGMYAVATVLLVLGVLRLIRAFRPTGGRP